MVKLGWILWHKWLFPVGKYPRNLPSCPGAQHQPCLLQHRWVPLIPSSATDAAQVVAHEGSQVNTSHNWKQKASATALQHDMVYDIWSYFAIICKDDQMIKVQHVSTGWFKHKSEPNRPKTPKTIVLGMRWYDCVCGVKCIILLKGQVIHGSNVIDLLDVYILHSVGTLNAHSCSKSRWSWLCFRFGLRCTLWLFNIAMV